MDFETFKLTIDQLDAVVEYATKWRFLKDHGAPQFVLDGNRTWKSPGGSLGMKKKSCPSRNLLTEQFGELEREVLDG
jgi:hypothetical protein